MMDDESPWIEKGEDLDRILALSDGVFGFALTLLATGIDIPELVGQASTQLSSEILSLVPQFAIYAVTFFFVIIKWMVHRRIFKVVKRYDSTLIWLNNLFLLFIAFMPVPSKILVEYPTQSSAIIFFAAMHILTTLVQQGMFAYATDGSRLTSPNLDPAWIRLISWRNWIQIGVMAASIGIAVISPSAALMFWLAPFGVDIFVARRVRMRRHLYRTAAHDRDAGA